MLKKMKLLLLPLFISPLMIFGNPYVVGDLIGQLGNQFFIIAATVSLALDNGAIAVFPDLQYETSQNIPLNREHIFFRVPVHLPHVRTSIYHEPHFHYAKIPYTPNMKIHGYFQSEKYFAHHKKEILELFAPSDEIMEYLQGKYSDILDDPNTVSIHVRFYHEDPEEKFYVGCKREFIETAMSFFPEDTHFIVFSNNTERCKLFLSGIEKNFRFIEGETHYHDLYLMSLCKNNIICNSTFSWWAAYLNPNASKKIIAPGAWFTPQAGLSTQDLFPETWIVLQ